jgi:thiol-disulfide isomerase/thioredoxin
MNNRNNILLLIVFIGFACQNNSQSNKKRTSFNLNGTLIGFKNTSVLYLERDSILDSAIINEGKFSFEGILNDSIEHVLLRTKDSKEYTFLWLENSNIFFENTTAGSLHNPIIKGSSIQSEFDHYNHIISSYYKTRDSVGKLIMSGPSTEEGVILNYISNRNDSLINDVTYEYIKNNSHSIVSISLLNDYSTIFGKQKTEVLFKLIRDDLKNTAFGKAVKNFIILNKETALGSPYTDFTQYDENDKEVKLSSFIGKIILVEFWAPWCAPCKRENPGLLAVYNNYKERGFELIAVNIDSDKSAWKKAIKENKLIWVNVSERGDNENTAALVYGINEYPSNILINEKGIIIKKNLRYEELSNELNKLFKNKP